MRSEDDSAAGLAVKLLGREWILVRGIDIFRLRILQEQEKESCPEILQGTMRITK